MYFKKSILKNLSQGARLEYVRRLRHMNQDDVAEYFGFGIIFTIQKNTRLCYTFF